MSKHVSPDYTTYVFSYRNGRHRSARRRMLLQLTILRMLPMKSVADETECARAIESHMSPSSVVYIAPVMQRDPLLGTGTG